MAYIDKCFYHDFHDRQIPLQNHKDGWIKDWDLDSVSLRRRQSDSGECLSIEVWPHGKDDQFELILSKDNAAKLAYRILMSLAELNVEDVVEYQRERIENLEHKMNWLEPVIEEQRELFRKRKHEQNKG